MKIATCALLLLLVSACSAEKSTVAEGKPVPHELTNANKLPRFSEGWNKTFHLRETENGEVLTIGAVFGDGSGVYVYDLAAGAVVVLDSQLVVHETVPLAPVGRSTYVGDDFVVLDTCFIFLNSIDRKLEYFSREHGTHLRSVPIPRDILATAEKRSHRILSRLFVDNGHLLVGNEYLLVIFDPILGKKSASTAIAAEKETRFVLYSKNGAIVQHDTLLSNTATGKKQHIPATHHSVTGKRFFKRGAMVYSVIAGTDSVAITVVP